MPEPSIENSSSTEPRPQRPAPFRIVTVCTGNICRSAMAKVILRSALDAAGLTQVEVDSCGTSNNNAGNPADPRAEEMLAGLGLTADGHIARQVNAEDWENTDLFLAADAGHVQALRDLAPAAYSPSRIRLIRSFESGAAHLTEEELGMPDPYPGDTTDFELTREQIIASVPGIVDWVREAMQ